MSKHWGHEDEKSMRRMRKLFEKKKKDKLKTSNKWKYRAEEDDEQEDIDEDLWK